jgi:hypothetical protein
MVFFGSLLRYIHTFGREPLRSKSRAYMLTIVGALYWQNLGTVYEQSVFRSPCTSCLFKLGIR